MGLRQTEPKQILRNYTLAMGQKNSWTFGGFSTYNDISAQFKTQFTNRMDLSVTEAYVFSVLNTRLLRGGPAFRLSPYWKNTLQFNTDKSDRIIFSLENNTTIGTDGVSRLFSIKPGLIFRLGNHLYIISDFTYAHNVDDFLYVTQISMQEGLRYLLGRIGQNTYNFTLRFNYNITPDLSIQYYGSPFISCGRYNNFKSAVNAHSKNTNERYHNFTDEELSFNELANNYLLFEGHYMYDFNNPDFSFRQFRSNLVMRWEYHPGSTIYLVWENNRNSRDNYYIPDYFDNMNKLFGVQATNVFMVKISFWLGF
jgi:hypothetical protein